MQISIKPISDRAILDILQLLEMNDWLALCRLPFIPLHCLWIQVLQLWHKIELLPSPFLHRPWGHLPFSSTLSFILQPNITFIFPVFIFKPLAYNLDFHCTIFSHRLSLLCAININNNNNNKTDFYIAVVSYGTEASTVLVNNSNFRCFLRVGREPL